MGRKKIIILGMGRIGLPTAACLANAGHQVLGVDIDQRKVADIREGRIDGKEPGLSEMVLSAMESGTLRISTEPVRGDVFLLCLPTLLKEDRTCDLSAISSAMDSISNVISPGNLIILESTVPVHTTRDFLIPGLEKRGVDTCKVLFAYAPERIMSGRMLEEIRKDDRIIGVTSEKAAKLAREVYESFVEGDIFITDTSTAELVKLAENTYRDINIAYANEVALFCQREGIDARRAIELANRHPRVEIHRPGPGVGGHCIPVVPHFLAQNNSYDMMIKAARKVNESMPRYIANMITRTISGAEQPKVSLMGMAYKSGSGDTVNSPGLQILEHLQGERMEILLCDPLVRNQEMDLVEMEEALSSDCIVFLVAHQQFKEIDPPKPKKAMATVIDTANCIEPRKWIRQGWKIKRFASKNPKA